MSSEDLYRKMAKTQESWDSWASQYTSDSRRRAAIHQARTGEPSYEWLKRHGEKKAESERAPEDDAFPDGLFGTGDGDHTGLDDDRGVPVFLSRRFREAAAKKDDSPVEGD
jgi:hypothetical protein